MTFWETARLKTRRAWFSLVAFVRALVKVVGGLFIGVGGVWIFFLLTDGLTEFLKAPIGTKEAGQPFPWTPIVLLVVGFILYSIADEDMEGRAEIGPPQDAP